MARPTKQGVDYFPLYCQLDGNVELFIAETGAAGYGVLITLWQMIYREKGYYIDYSDDLFLLLKRELLIPIDESKPIVEKAIERDIFSKSVAEKCGILTSAGIQTRYFYAAKKKKTVVYDPKHLLCEVYDYGNLSCSGVSA